MEKSIFVVLFRSEFLGKLAIPLLRIEPGKKRWYVLKDKKLRCRAKGNNPKILLEMNLVRKKEFSRNLFRI